MMRHLFQGGTRKLLLAMGLYLLSAASFNNAYAYQGSELRFEHLLKEDALARQDVGSIKTMAQDRFGFMWIGAEYGLARYDGTRVARYPANASDPTSLASNYINALTLDTQGVLWIATDAGLHRYNYETDDFSRIALPDDTAQNNRVSSLAVDRSGRLIVGKDAAVGIFDPATDNYQNFILPYMQLTGTVSVTAVFVDRDNRIWAGTRGAGAALLDPESGRYHFVTQNWLSASGKVDINITAIAQDKHGRMWFGSQSNGLARLDPSSGEFRRYRHVEGDAQSLGSDMIWDIHTNSRGEIWVATDQGGLSIYQPTSDNFHNVRHKAFDASSISSNQLRAIFEDTRGDVWIGVFPSGLEFYNRASAQFTNYSHRPDEPHSLSHSAILTVLEDAQGTLWVGTERGLNALDRDTGRFTRYTRGSDPSVSLSADAVLSVCEDGNDHLWIGTWSGGVQRLNKRSGRFETFRPVEGDSRSLNSAIVWSVVKDRQGRLWLGTEGGGLNLYHPEDDSFSQWVHQPDDATSINSNYIWTMLLGRKGEIWVGTTAGLNRFDPDSQTFERIALRASATEQDRVRSLREDRHGRLWVGTQDNGFYILDPSDQSVRHFGQDINLPSLYVTGFVEDTGGLMWATTTRGLVRIDPKTMATQLFDRNDGLIGQNFNREANWIDSRGEIYVGSTDGLSKFDPAQLQPADNAFPVMVTGLRILNRPVSVKDSDGLLERAVWLSDEVVFDHRHAMFTFEFSTLDHRNRIDRRYAYKMEGFDRDWNSIGPDTSATFTNLSPGRYTFHVKAGNAQAWGSDMQSLSVRVLPPPWASAWAYAAYVLAGGLVIFLFTNGRIKHHQLASQQQTNRELIKLNEIKDAFLANTSHELRTPLNGIIGIADALAEHLRSDSFASTRLQLIATSGRRLANLINDILDYSKLSKQRLELDLKALDLAELVDLVFALLAPLTVDKPVRLVNGISHGEVWVWADGNRLQQILINLVGNGIKYTPEGEVRVAVRPRGQEICVLVQDTGIGIASEQQQAVFEAFHQVQSSTTRQYGGTGLGLAITKQLVELHGGSIWLETPVEGGTRVAFSLRACDDAQARLAAAATDETTSRAAPSTQPSMAPPPAGKPTVERKPRNARDQTVLVVDDDGVNRMVLRGYLELHQYQVLEAESGTAAVEMLESNPQIDLIIMDVMMPKMSGFEACETIRKTHPSHLLPVLFLTAKTNTEKDLATCFSVGGNDFLTKPVSKDDLLPRVANHLRIQGVIRQLQFELERARLHGQS